jgi:hypothetical protein
MTFLKLLLVGIVNAELAFEFHVALQASALPDFHVSKIRHGAALQTQNYSRMLSFFPVLQTAAVHHPIRQKDLRILPGNVQSGELPMSFPVMRVLALTSSLSLFFFFVFSLKEFNTTYVRFE